MPISYRLGFGKSIQRIQYFVGRTSGSKRWAFIRRFLALILFAGLMPVGTAAQNPIPPPPDTQQSQSTDVPDTSVELLQTAKILYVDSQTRFLESALLESELQKQPEFTAWKMAVTREKGKAEMVIEVVRSRFTNDFTYSVIDPKTQNLLLSGKVDSLFGTAAGKIARDIFKKMKKARQSALVNRKPRLRRLDDDED